MHRFLGITLLLFSAISPTAASEQERVPTSEEVSRLASFAKLYGYVRFFHPSDEASLVDWDAFAIHGVEHVMRVSGQLAFDQELLRLIRPIGPTIEIAKSLPPHAAPKKHEEVQFVSWQHFGIRLSDEAPVYESQRLNRNPNSTPLFSLTPSPGETQEGTIGNDLFCRIPLSLPADDTGTLPHAKRQDLEVLLGSLRAINVAEASTDEEQVRLAGVVIAWNVLQHFYPYFDVAEVDWNSALETALTEALVAQGEHEFVEVLQRMVAQLHDGHGVVYAEDNDSFALPPVRVDWVEDKVVVVAAGETELVKTGDIVTRIDGRSAEEEVNRREALISGSPQLRRRRALNVFGLGDPAEAVELVITRGSKELTVTVPRSNTQTKMFFSAYEPWAYPAIRRLDDGIVHLNLRKLDKDTFAKNLQSIVSAQGIIVDYRWGGGKADFEVLRHLTDRPLDSPRFFMPLVIYPNRREIGFEEFRWKLDPKEPRINGRAVYLQGPADVSSAETVLEMVEHNKLAELVGVPSGGCNGNVNFIPLPGGIRIMFTGMKTLKNDGSQHHLVGIEPGHLVEQTIAGHQAGRDEVLEKAIEIITN